MAIDGNYGMFLENAGSVYNAREYRRLFDRMLQGYDVRSYGGSATEGTGNGGIARPSDMEVTERDAGANMSVDVSLGGAMVGGTESAQQGNYFAYSDATINVAIAASDPVDDRIDIVGIRVRDSEYSGATDDTQVVVVTGTAAPVPTEPTLPDNFYTLARVDVAGAAASIVDANITDRRELIGPFAVGWGLVASATGTPPGGSDLGAAYVEMVKVSAYTSSERRYQAIAQAQVVTNNATAYSRLRYKISADGSTIAGTWDQRVIANTTGGGQSYYVPVAFGLANGLDGTHDWMLEGREEDGDIDAFTCHIELYDVGPASTGPQAAWVGGPN